MAAKLKCTKCKAVLSLAKVPAPGKKVRCPKCQEIFTVPEEDELDEEEEAVPRKKAAKKSNPAIKKAEPAKAAAPKPAKAAPAPEPVLTKEEREEAEAKGTYGFLDTGETEEEREKNEPKIDYAPDMSVRDPRGAAVAKLATPSTVVLCYGGIIGIAGVFLLLSGIWPFMFSDTVADPRTGRNVSLGLEKTIRIEKQQQLLKGLGFGVGKTQTERLKAQILAAENDLEDFAKLVDPLIRRAERSEEYIEPIPPDRFEKEDKVGYLIWQLMEERETTLHTWLIAVSVPILLFGVVMGYGAVKMQTLESRIWGIVSSIMGIVFALGVVGFAIYLFTRIDDEAGVMDYLTVMLLILANIGGGAGSAWGLKTVLDEKMKEAFEFDPEEEEQKAKEKKDGDEDEDEEDEDDEEDDE